MNEKINVYVEEIKLKGSELLDQVKSLAEEGNARRVMIKKEGRVLLEFPLSVGVGGAAAAILLAPTLAAVGAVAALVTDVSLIVEREAPADKPIPPPVPNVNTGSDASADTM